MTGTPPPPDLVEQVHAHAPSSWTSLVLTSRSIGLRTENELRCELADGGTVWLSSIDLDNRFDALNRDTAREGVGAYFVATLRWLRGGEPELELDYDSNPWPRGWRRPSVLEYVRGPGIPHREPAWLAEQRPSGPDRARRPPSTAALWRAAAEGLLERLPGDGWTLRGKGVRLAIVREVGSWLLDVVMLDKAVREGTTFHAATATLIAGGNHITWRRGARGHLGDLDSPGAVRQLHRWVLGPGLAAMETVQPVAQALGRPTGWTADGRSYGAAEVAGAVEDAAWRVTRPDDDSVGTYLDEVDELLSRHRATLTVDQEHWAEAHDQLRELRRAWDAGPAAVRALLRERRDRALAGSGLADPPPTRGRGGVLPAWRPPTDWPELTAGLTAAVATLPVAARLGLHEWRDGGVRILLRRLPGTGPGTLEAQLPPVAQLHPWAQLRAQQVDLSEGWEPPGAAGQRWPAWTRRASAGEQGAADLVAATVGALRSAYGIDLPERLGWTLWWGTWRLRLPMLPLLPYFSEGHGVGNSETLDELRTGQWAVVAGVHHPVRASSGGWELVTTDPAAVRPESYAMAQGTYATPVDARDLERAYALRTVADGLPAGWTVLRRSNDLVLVASPGGEQQWVSEDAVAARPVETALLG